MTITIKKIKVIISRYRNLFRSDRSTPVVKVIEEDLESRNLDTYQDFDTQYPDDSFQADARPEISTRTTPDSTRTYNPDAGEDTEIAADMDIDLSRDDQFEAYALGTRVSAETLEKWIAAGILCPDEIRAAEKLLKMIRKKKRDDIRMRKI